ncbi:MAG TPA: beta-ketoacyl synthase N-terminal-like domain-containing protein [Longimicrobium sp.]|jgi:acyl transferase domain-containing protein/acyl carrier protein|uniref:type I polyketide synthase n=1 Tax=Longimicrobium sp. TaxID=2029185 RepID=UPI002EDB791B
MSEHEQARADELDRPMADMEEVHGEFDVAVIGMSGRFPGADSVDEFWANLRDGVEGITHFTDDELRAAGVPEAHLAHPDYVRSIGRLRDVQHFDAGFFGYSPREAEILEPSHRLFLECAWEAMENAGYAPEHVRGRVGVYAGSGAPMYVEQHVRNNPALMGSVGHFQANLASGKDFIATRTAYKLNLRGPALTVQTACSTSLVAVHLAAQSLLSGESDMALAGGATVLIPQDGGYLYSHGGISSPDGHCRAFDEQSAGTLSGSGVGVVVLKRLADALRDGDPVRAVIRGSAINNDGSAKVAFTAPGVEGQSSAIREALSAADVDPSSITYVETHGTGTELGDTIEIAALTRAYRTATEDCGFCALGAAKTSVGHLDTAAGVTGLIKTVLSLEHAQIPPTLHFTRPNPKIDFAASPFFVCNELRDWTPAPGHPRRAGVSSFGIGGTNAHVILEEAPPREPSGPSRPWQLLTVSARSPRALDAATDRLAAHLEANPQQPLADVAFTLREGRRAFPHRRTVVVRDGENAAALLRDRLPDRVAMGVAESGSRSVAFLFPGLGDQYPGMARGLYEAEPVFRAEVDRCAELLKPALGMDLRDVLFAGPPPSDAAPVQGFDLKAMLGRSSGAADPRAERLNRTELAQPAVFVIDYALAKLWMSWGIVPDAVIGHSLGEYAAACIAGVLTLEDALALVADRARLIGGLPGGSMLAVSLSEPALRPFLSPDTVVATVNAPELTVAAGPDDAIAALEAALTAAGHTARRLATTHAFHSPMMAPALAPLAERAARAELRPPRIPMISNVTGTWITDAEATDPAHWTRHLMGTVRFAEGVSELLSEPRRVLVEVGPGQTLSTFVRQRADGEPAPAAAIPSLRYAYDRRPDTQFLLDALGRLWLAGVEVDWAAVRGAERRQRLALPTYPWERQRYWVELPQAEEGQAARVAANARHADPAQWIHAATWTRTPAPAAPSPGHDHILLMSSGQGLADRVTSALDRVGYNVISVRPDTGFSAGKRMHTVRPALREDYRQMTETLASIGMRPRAVVHALALSDVRMAIPSLLLFADALAASGAPTELIVLTEGAQQVTGDEEPSPLMAALLGVARGIEREHPHLACRVVDVPAGAPTAELAPRIAAEILSGGVGDVVALRGRHRWVRAFHPVRTASPAARIRENGGYLLVGAGSARIAAAIAETPGVRMAFILPTGQGGEADGAAETIRADLADPASLTEAVTEAETRLGRIDGVLYAPDLSEIVGIAGVGEAAAEWADQLAAVERTLEAMRTALGDRRPEWIVAHTSLAGQLGAVGHVRVTAAHTLIDAFAARAGWTALAVDRAATEADPDGIAPDELRAAFDHALALAGEAQLLVSTTDLQTRWNERAEAARPADVLYERPELESEYHAPTNEVEEALAELWQSLLGIRRIGIHDDFFGMGGHSLLATQIVARVRDMFQLELPLQSIFEAPTIAKFAELIETAIIAELESISDDEAAEIMGRA